MKTKTKKPAKKSKAAASAPEPTLAEREARHYQEIRALETTCDRLEGEYEAAKAAASGAKSLWSEAVARLRESIRRGPDPQLGLQFGAKVTPGVDEYMETDVMDAFPSLTGPQVDALDDAGVRTVRALHELHKGPGLRSVKGFGPAIADKIEDMLLDWLAAQHKKAEAAAIADMDNGGDEDEDGDA
jgi:hypothetical protein